MIITPSRDPFGSIKWNFFLNYLKKPKLTKEANKVFIEFVNCTIYGGMPIGHTNKDEKKLYYLLKTSSKYAKLSFQISQTISMAVKL